MSGIWIRSQNKEVLLYSGKLQYANNDSKHLIISVENVTKDGTDALVVGEYPTKERAIEVLDEIQPCLFGRYLINDKPAIPGSIVSHNRNETISYIPSTLFYQMPQGEDVSEGGGNSV